MKKMDRIRDNLTKSIYEGKVKKDFSQELTRICLRKILFVLSRNCLNDFNIPPSNHFEKLQGDRQGQYSIRVNDQYRVCFEWDGVKAVNIEIVDYHK